MTLEDGTTPMNEDTRFLNDDGTIEYAIITGEDGFLTVNPRLDDVLAVGEDAIAGKPGSADPVTYRAVVEGEPLQDHEAELAITADLYVGDPVCSSDQFVIPALPGRWIATISVANGRVRMLKVVSDGAPEDPDDSRIEVLGDVCIDTGKVWIGPSPLAVTADDLLDNWPDDFPAWAAGGGTFADTGRGGGLYPLTVHYVGEEAVAVALDFGGEDDE